MAKKKRLLAGWRETVSLPDLGLTGFKAKIDTGARTTALHATNITVREVDGHPWVEFLPDHDAFDRAEVCRMPVLHTRKITNTGGVPQERLIVATRLRIGGRTERIEVSLTDRSDMKFPIIIGRSALRLLRLNVNPSRSWLLTDRPTLAKEDPET